MMTEFEDSDLLETIQDKTGFNMSEVIVFKKEIVDDKLRVYFRPKRE